MPAATTTMFSLPRMAFVMALTVAAVLQSVVFSVHNRVLLNATTTSDLEDQVLLHHNNHTATTTRIGVRGSSSGSSDVATKIAALPRPSSEQEAAKDEVVVKASAGEKSEKLWLSEKDEQTTGGITIDDTTTTTESNTEHAEATAKERAGEEKEKELTETEKDLQTTAVKDDDNTISASSYQVDDLCGGCRYKIGSRGIRCGKIFADRAKKDNTTLKEAALVELARGGDIEKCRTCVECDPKFQKYWRPDHAAPTVTKATTHYLTSIPEEDYRIPRDVLAKEGNDELTKFFEQEPNHYPAKRYFFEYNPSIVPFVVNNKQHAFSIDGKVPSYVASYRVGTQQSCFPPNTTLPMIGGSWQKRPESISYVAIALLDEDLSLMADVTLDLPGNFGFREDFRLFVIRGKLYLTSFCKITPLYLGTKSQPPYSNVSDTQPFPPKFPSSQNLVLTLGKRHTHCSNDHDNKANAKNLNYFIDGHNQTVVELIPQGDLMTKFSPRQIQPVDLTTMPTNQNPHQLYGAGNVTRDSTTPERPSFYTLDEIELTHRHDYWESPYVADRGSACCVEFDNPHIHQPTESILESSESKLLLGISHTKIPYGRSKMMNAGLTSNQYLSRFYAMESVAPYRTVAKSGYICLSQFESSAGANPLARRPLWQKFVIGNMELDCPAIHFVTGMTEKVNDPSTLIIAYGVGDCTSWFVEVSKQEVIDMLFDAPTEKPHQATLSSLSS